MTPAQPAPAPAAIVFESVEVQYDGAPRPALTGVDLLVEEGELALVVGPTGSGKSTLLGCVNGLVPHFTGGTLRGRVLVDGRDTRTHRPRDLADVVGVVAQDPAGSFVTDTVEEEIAYGMECLGLPAGTMRRRAEESLDLVGLADVRARSLRSLSGGQQQRVAIAAVLAAHPRVLVLDEPTSALDPVAAEEVLSALTRLVHDLGLTVLLAEHRLERVVQYADRVVLLEPSGTGTTVLSGDPADVMGGSPVVPPVVALGRAAGWRPLPLSVRDARRQAAGLRRRLADREPRRAHVPAPVAASAATEPPLVVDRLVVRHGPTVALRGADLRLTAGTVTALMGRNGAGKSTLLGAVAGQLRATSGSVRVDGVDPGATPPATLVRSVGLVPQDPMLLLYAEDVARECASADGDFGVAPGTCRALLERLAPGVDDAMHPRDLSEGQRLALALSVVLSGSPRVVLLDEPTRGLDYPTKERLVELLRGLVADGCSVLLATHDVELAAEAADRVVVLADGDVVADGPAPAVLAGSPAFAPQVAKVLHPLPWLTVGDVVAALEDAS